MRQAFDAAGITSMAYVNFSGAAAIVVSTTGTGTPLSINDTNWDWQSTTAPTQSSGPERGRGSMMPFARPYTRTGTMCPGSPMTYPDGTIATGFFNNDSSDPRNTEVYDAGCSADIFGNVQISYDYDS